MYEPLPQTLLLTGATGFVGRHLYHALAAAGYAVRCASRDPERAAQLQPERHWVHLEVDDPASIEAAMDGCNSAYFLIHRMSGGSGYPEREARSARTFAACAVRQGLDRVVYLGGVIPRAGQISRHLQSRQLTGEILRHRAPGAVELRAAMIIGHGSKSWTMVRDLSARLPAMILPRWLSNTSHPIFIDDVVCGLLGALTLPRNQAGSYELPGPERITHRDMLERAASAQGRPRRWLLDVPMLSPRLSSYWIGLVTRVKLELAQELVEGLRHDLEPSGTSLWPLIDREPTPLDQAMRLALSDERADRNPSPESVRRLRAIGMAHRGDVNQPPPEPTRLPTHGGQAP